MNKSFELTHTSKNEKWEEYVSMNDTVCLLKECNAGCKSATNSMEQVMGYVKKLLDE